MLRLTLPVATVREICICRLLASRTVEILDFSLQRTQIRSLPCLTLCSNLSTPQVQNIVLPNLPAFRTIYRPLFSSLLFLPPLLTTPQSDYS
jgi:hypothetical protein